MSGQGTVRCRGIVALLTAVPLLLGLAGPVRAAVPTGTAAVRPAAAAGTTGTAPVTVQVQVSASPVVAGRPLRATASVVGAGGQGSQVPSGSVQFTVDGSAVGAPVALVGGQGSAPLTLTVGAHRVGARYTGDGAFAAGDSGPGISTVVVPPGTASFVPVQPARILDTRPATQTGYSGSKPQSGATVPLQVAGRGGVPAGGAVSAVVLNVTATAASGPGFVTVWPAGTPRPLASNLNLEYAGETIPNLVVVPLSATGVVDLYASASTHLIADVAGYFVGAQSATGGRFVPVNPARLLDTRPGSGQTGYTGTKPHAGTTVTLRVAGRGGVPATGATGVVLNVTATGTDATPGFVTAWPSDRPRPLASNLNITHGGETVPNAVWVPLSGDGTLNLYVSTGTDLVADVAGWFTGTADPDSTAGLFVPTRPTRILDTRPGNSQVGYTGGKPKAGSLLALKVTGAGASTGAAGTAVPAKGVAAAVLNVTATQGDGAGFVTAYPDGSARPTASNLNIEHRGQTRPNLVTTPLGAGSVDLYTSVGTHLVADVAGWFTPDPDPPATPTQHETVQPAAGTVMLNPGDAAAVTGDPSTGYTVTLAAGVPVPAQGAGVVLKGGGSAYPDGLSGTVTAVATAGGVSKLTLTPTAPDQLLDNLDIGYDGAANLTLESTSGGSSARGSAARVAPAARPADVGGGTVGVDNSLIDFGAGAFSCDVSSGVSVTAAVVRFENTRVHFEKRAGLLTTPYVSFYVTTEPVVEFTGEVHGIVSCHLSDLFRTTHRLVWVLPTEIPVTVDLAPALQFDATAAGTVGFTEHFYRMIGLSTNPDLSLHYYNGASQTNEGVNLGAKVSASLLIGADVSVKLLDIAGIGVTMGPQFVISLDNHGCVQLTVGIHADFDVRINLWIKQFKQTFLGLDLGPWTLAYRCPSGSAGAGGSPLTVRTTDLPSAVVGQGYSATLQAVGGTQPYTWAVTGLPPGLIADSAGHIGGTPTTGGYATLTVTVTDADGATATGGPSLSTGSAVPGATLVSAGSAGQPGNGLSDQPMISDDGAYVYYESTSTDLTADALPADEAVYLYDVAARTTKRLFAPDGSTNVGLLAVSGSGRYALIGDRYGNSDYRYDRVTGTYTLLGLGGTDLSGIFQIADDGDLVYTSSEAVERISTGARTPLHCPDGTIPLQFHADSVQLAANGSAVYFTAANCGSSQYAAFRQDLATGTTVTVSSGNCYFNAGNACVDQVEPNSVGTHQAVSKLVSSPDSWSDQLLVDGYARGGIVTTYLYLCGVADDGSQVVFRAWSDLTAGDTAGGTDLYALDVPTGTVTRLSPTGGGGTGWSGCSASGYAGAANRVAYVYNEQVYLQPTR